MADSPQRYSNWLFKKGKLRRNWTQRWFILDNGTLTYSNTEKTKPKGSFPIKGIECVRMASSSTKYVNGFEVRTPKRVFFLRALNATDYEIWKTKLKEHGAIWKQVERSESKILSDGSVVPHKGENSSQKDLESSSSPPTSPKEEKKAPEEKHASSTNYEEEEHEIIDLGIFDRITNKKPKWGQKRYLIDVDAAVLYSAKPINSEEIPIKALGKIQSCDVIQESGRQFCIKFQVSNQKTYILDGKSRERLEQVLTYVELINIKAGQREARKQRKALLNIATLSDSVEKKYGFEGFTANQMQYHKDQYRNYLKADYQTSGDISKLELTGTNPTVAAPKSSAPAIVHVPAQGNYSNDSKYANDGDDISVQDSKYSNDGAIEDKYVNDDKPEVDAHVRSKEGYQVISSLPAPEEEKKETHHATKNQRKYTKENWKDVGAPLVEARKQLNDVGANELFEPLVKICNQERNVFEKLVGHSTFKKSDHHPPISQEKIESIVSEWRSFSAFGGISRGLKQAISTKKLDLEAGGIWMEPFGLIADSPFKASEKGVMMGSLVEDFVTVAEYIVKTIIEELHLTNDKKKFPSVDVGGRAGGVKYKQYDIFIKLSLDNNGLYAGDNYSMKAAKHEFKSAHAIYNTLYNIHNPSVSVPLMCVIDYKGYRATAMSCLPIGSDTLISGSDDGGDTVQKVSPQFNDILESVAQLWNLKRHTLPCSNGDEEVVGPFDLEGHFGRDARFYICDTARLFPPEKTNTKIPGSFLYRLLRPEFVLSYKQPLSSDTYISSFCTRKDIKEVEDATNFLRSHVIPVFATKKLVDFWPLVEEMGHDYLVTVTHQHGINVRHLGLVRALVSGSTNDGIKARKWILVEIFARIIKNHLRSAMRTAVVSNFTEKRNEILLKSLDEAFGNGEKTNLFWKSHVISIVERDFYDFLRCEGNNDVFKKPFPDHELFPEIIDRTLVLTGLQVEETIYPQLLKNLGSEHPFSQTLSSPDTFSYVPRIVSYSSAFRLKGHNLRRAGARALGINPDADQFDPNVQEHLMKALSGPLTPEAEFKMRSAKYLFGLALRFDTFDTTSENLYITLNFLTKGKGTPDVINQKYLINRVSGTPTSWFQDLLTKRIEAEFDKTLDQDLKEAQALMQKFSDGGFKDAEVISQAVSKLQFCGIKARQLRDSCIVEIEPRPGAMGYAKIVELLARASYYEEYLKNNGVPRLSICLFLFALEAYRTVPAALVVKEMAHLNELISLLFQQIQQPLPALVLEMSLLRLIRSIGANFQQCYVNLASLLQTFPKIDPGSTLRFQVMAIIARLKPREEALQVLNSVAQILAPVLPEQELQFVLNQTEPQLFSTLLGIQEKLRNSEPGDVIRQKLRDADAFLMTPEQRKKAVEIQSQQMINQFLMGGLFGGLGKK